MPRGNSEGFRADNKFKVPQKTWGSWTLVARHVFNKTFETAIKNQEFFHHTENIGAGGMMMKKHWRVTAWNFAFTAASICSRGERHILADLTNKMKGK